MHLFSVLLMKRFEVSGGEVQDKMRNRVRMYRDQYRGLEYEYNSSGIKHFLLQQKGSSSFSFKSFKRFHKNTHSALKSKHISFKRIILSNIYTMQKQMSLSWIVWHKTTTHFKRRKQLHDKGYSIKTYPGPQECNLINIYGWALFLKLGSCIYGWVLSFKRAFLGSHVCFNGIALTKYIKITEFIIQRSFRTET